eukprot:GHVH01001235.1.p1 GENE.GHVH01001235.1~~GHVH01001235.1.p1  ORF type:complete len:389 (+),score=57.16 GHVH01001235.1:90-1256(+)
MTMNNNRVSNQTKAHFSSEGMIDSQGGGVTPPPVSLSNGGLILDISDSCATRSPGTMQSSDALSDFKGRQHDVWRKWGFDDGRQPSFLHPSNAQCDNKIIGVCGISGSGKSTLSSTIVDFIGPNCAVIPCDSFYKALDEEERQLALASLYDFDHPSSIDWESYKTVLRAAIKTTGFVRLPVYSFKLHTQLHPMLLSESPLEEMETDETMAGGQVIDCANTSLVLTEGILIFSAPKEVTDLMDYKVFVDTDPNTALILRSMRDTKERGRSTESVYRQYLKFVLPSNKRFILPSKKIADTVLYNNFNPLAGDECGGMSRSAVRAVVLMAVDMVGLGNAGRENAYQTGGIRPRCCSHSCREDEKNVDLRGDPKSPRERLCTQSYVSTSVPL